jgi:hypothetical protein
MKRTINIPKALYERAKLRMEETGQTLEELVLFSLERALAVVPLVETTTKNYWSNRKMRPEFKRLWESGEFGGGTESTQIISEDRDGR